MGPPARRTLATLGQLLRFGVVAKAVNVVLCAVDLALTSALEVTGDIASRLVRLPPWVGHEAQRGNVIETLTRALQESAR